MKKAKTVFLIGVSFLLLAFTVYTFLGPFSKISIVRLKAGEKLKADKFYRQKEQEILSLVQAYKGKLLWQVSLQNLVEQINSLYREADISATRKFPNQINVFLTKKNAVLILMKEDGGFYPISHRGEIGSKKGPGESFDFPILRGDQFWKQLKLRKRALSIIFSIPEKGQPLSAKNISEIYYNGANDSWWIYLVSSHFIVELKDPLLPGQIKNIDFVLNYLHQQGRKEGLIDARWDKKIVVKNLN